jgi:hypothetical protein
MSQQLKSAQMLTAVWDPFCFRIPGGSNVIGIPKSSPSHAVPRTQGSLAPESPSSNDDRPATRLMALRNLAVNHAALKWTNGILEDPAKCRSLFIFA